MAKWTTFDIPDQSGRVVVITGANSGIGYEAALALAAKGAHVIMACRSVEKAEAAAAQIREQDPAATLKVMGLDLADLTSVRVFADAFSAEFNQLDVLINNAGVMAIPYRQTADGFEMQFGTNHLGHFALTGLLLDMLLATSGARIVNVSSSAHRFGKMRFDDLQGEASYTPFGAYGQSKLANMLFTLELKQRLLAKGADVLAIACHPGWAATNLQAVGPEMAGSAIRVRLSNWTNRVVAQSAAMGALPTLYAAIAPVVKSGDFIGPEGLMHSRGYPAKERAHRRAYDGEAAALLWEISQKLTGVYFEAL